MHFIFSITSATAMASKQFLRFIKDLIYKDGVDIIFISFYGFLPEFTAAWRDETNAGIKEFCTCSIDNLL